MIEVYTKEAWKEQKCLLITVINLLNLLRLPVFLELKKSCLEFSGNWSSSLIFRNVFMSLFCN